MFSIIKKDKKLELPADISRVCVHKELSINKNHAYNLAELIDIAQSNNPDIRIAWEQSKQTAFAVGLIKASYLPQISADVLSGQQYLPLPAPKILVNVQPH